MPDDTDPFKGVDFLTAVAAEAAAWDAPDPICDPDTGEVLAYTTDERAALRQTCCDYLAEAAAAQQRATWARKVLAAGRLLQVGDAVLAGPEGWAVMVEPAKAPSRSINTTALEHHREKLASIEGTAHLAPHDEPQPDKRVFPTVGQLTTKQSRARLALLGLTPEQLLTIPDHDPHAFTVVVVGPQEATP